MGGEALVLWNTLRWGGQRGEGGGVRSQSLPSRTGVTPEEKLGAPAWTPNTPPSTPLALRALLYLSPGALI